MKMIIAIIRPDKFEAVQAALVAHQIYLMTVSDVRGCGTQKGFAEQFRGNKIGLIRLLPKVKLEIAVSTDVVQAVVDAIARAANTGKIGDGKVFITDLEAALRIRTGERDASAITG